MPGFWEFGYYVPGVLKPSSNIINGSTCISQPVMSEHAMLLRGLPEQLQGLLKKFYNRLWDRSGYSITTPGTYLHILLMKRAYQKWVFYNHSWDLGKAPPKKSVLFRTLSYTVGGWGTRVLNFLVKQTMSCLYSIFDHST